MGTELSPALAALGFGADLAAHLAALGRTDVMVGRIVRYDRICALAATDAGEIVVDVPGRLRRRRDGNELPCVGDWVALTPLAGGNRALLAAILPRHSQLVRHVAGTENTSQVLAANIDTLFLVSGLDRDFNVRRIERYLTLAWQSGAQPVVVLNKADTCSDLDFVLKETELVASGAPVHAVSAVTELGIDVLRSYLGPGRTGALVGSSGVGKSTLLNALLGEQRMLTGAVRPADQRGRHVTSHRELVVLPSNAGCLIDTPGLRELQLWGDQGGLLRAFADVVAFAARCRFQDCSHDVEPDCAVRGAVESGELAGDRFESYRALQEEMGSLKARTREHAARREGRKGAAAARAQDRQINRRRT